jgi:hypothetical protein
LKTNVEWAYVVINQLIKSMQKATHLENFLTYMLGGNKYQFNKKWPRLGLLKIRSKFGHSKVHNYLLVKFCCNFFQSIFFPSCIIYWICRNPNFGLVTKARVSKGVGQEWSSGITFHAFRSVGKCEGMNPHTPKWVPTLGVGIPMDS